MLRALLVDDQAEALQALTKLVEREGFTAVCAANLEQARTLVKADPPHVVLTDMQLPDGSGLELLRESNSIEVVLITGHATVETAVEALRLGAFDFLTKPVDVAHLKRVLSHIHRTHELRGEIGMLRDELRHMGRFGRLVGNSPSMQRVYELLAKVGPTSATVFLSGESGTGKELAALTLHDLSNRRGKPFLALNCGAVAPNMIESELFGHERGSFTGATQKHSGYFERAAGGTLLLDEITEMPLDNQVKLLRMLETQSLVRVGGEKEIPIDVRVLAATNRSPEAAVSEGKLRHDLFFRLRVFQVELPPLRERGEDVRLLSEHFLQALNEEAKTKKRFTEEALQRLGAYPWPGNVRELKNIVQSSFILADEEIGVDCLMMKPAKLAESLASPAPDLSTPAEGGAPVLRIPVGSTAAEAERQLILATLAHCLDDKNSAARMLDLSLKTIYNRLKMYQEFRS